MGLFKNPVEVAYTGSLTSKIKCTILKMHIPTRTFRSVHWACGATLILLFMGMYEESILYQHVVHAIIWRLLENKLWHTEWAKITRFFRTGFMGRVWIGLGLTWLFEMICWEWFEPVSSTATKLLLSKFGVVYFKWKPDDF